MCKMSRRFNRTGIQPVLEPVLLSHANVSCIVWLFSTVHFHQMPWGILWKNALEKSHTIACKYDASESVSWQRGRSEASAIAQCFPNNRFISHPQRHILLLEMRHKYSMSNQVPISSGHWDYLNILKWQKMTKIYRKFLLCIVYSSPPNFAPMDQSEHPCMLFFVTFPHFHRKKITIFPGTEKTTHLQTRNNSKNGFYTHKRMMSFLERWL